jgi:hypothetical protein
VTRVVCSSHIASRHGCAATDVPEPRPAAASVGTSVTAPPVAVPPEKNVTVDQEVHNCSEKISRVHQRSLYPVRTTTATFGEKAGRARTMVMEEVFDAPTTDG